MTSIVEIQRPISDLSADEKAKLAVSIAVTHRGKPFVVSHYSDPVWDFWSECGPKNRKRSGMRIRWHVPFGDGGNLLDEQHATLLESAKDFILSLKREPIGGRKRPCARTVIHKFMHLKVVLRYMVLQGITRFEDLQEWTMHFISFAKMKVRGHGEVVPRTHVARLHILEDLYQQRGKLNDTLKQHPWAYDTSANLAGYRQTFDNIGHKTKVIPDDVLKRLGSVALDYVEKKADNLLDARDTVEEKRKAGRIKYAGYSEETIKTYIERENRLVANRMGCQGVSGLIADLFSLRAACYIVIDMFSGIRDSEMTDLKVGCADGDVAEREGVEIIWLQGKVHKGGTRPHAWIVPPPVRTAARVLARLTRPLRDRMNAEEGSIKNKIQKGNFHRQEKASFDRRLVEIAQTRQILLLTVDHNNGNQISVLSNASTNDSLKRFCKRSGILGEDGKPYPLHPHQFRRTFAHYIARTKFFDLNYLSEHLAHWCVDCTAGYTHGAADTYEIDSDLLTEIEEERKKVQQEILTKELLEERPLASGKWLLDLRPKVMTAKDPRELVRKLSDNIRIIGTGVSWCITDNQSPCCGGDCFFKKAKCKDCSTSIISLDHLPAWKGIERQNRAILACEDLGEDCKEDAKNLLKKAENVIARLEGQGHQ